MKQLSEKGRKRLANTIEVLLDGIALGDVANLDPNKLDETSLRYITESVLSVDLEGIPRVILANKDFRRVFLLDLAGEVLAREAQLRVLLGELNSDDLERSSPSLIINSVQQAFVLVYRGERISRNISGAKADILNLLSSRKLTAHASASVQELCVKVGTQDAKAIRDAIANTNKLFKSKIDPKFKLIVRVKKSEYALSSSVFTS